MKRLALALFVIASAASCAKNSPSAPSQTQTATAAVLSITSFTATAETTASGVTYHVSIQVRETSGKTGATISAFNFAVDGGTATYNPATGKVAAGGTYDTGTINLNSTRATIAPQHGVTIAFTDDGSRSGSVTGSATVTTIAPPAPIQRFDLVGFVRDRTSNGALANATVRVTSGADSGQSTTSSSTGYYAFGGLRAGTFTVFASASGHDGTSQTVTLNANSQMDFALSATAPPVEYRITGTARRCSATYENSTGGTNQQAVTIPFSYTWNSARSGDFLYISCQIDTGGDQGNITVAIYKNGSLYRSAQAIGFPNIATASGSY